MKAAVVGAGFSGLALAWNLLNLKIPLQVDLIDRAGIGSGASGVAAGLLHPFTGLHAKLNRFGMEGYEETAPLLQLASQTLGRSVFKSTPLLRIATTPSMIIDYQKTAEVNPPIEWLPSVEPYLKGIKFPGILIHLAMIVDCPLYLKGLWQACQSRGASLIIREIQTVEELSNYDLIIFATGASNLFPEIIVNSVKGQVLEVNLPGKDLVYPINSQGYFFKSFHEEHFIAGATFEKTFTSEEADLSFAKEEIFAKLREIYPAIDEAQVLHCRAGLRASTKDHLPLIKQISAKVWTLTGMGSKGLLYHAFYAKKLREIIFQGARLS